jgi:hypothetical protein
MHQDLDPVGTPIGKQVRVVRPRRSEYGDHTRQRRLCAGSHVQGRYCEPDGLNANHRSSSRIQAAHSLAADTGQVMAMLVWPWRNSIRMSGTGAAGAGAGASATGTKVGTGATCALAPISRRHLCTTLALIPCDRATCAMDAPG